MIQGKPSGHKPEPLDNFKVVQGMIYRNEVKKGINSNQHIKSTKREIL